METNLTLLSVGHSSQSSPIHLPYAQYSYIQVEPKANPYAVAKVFTPASADEASIASFLFTLRKVCLKHELLSKRQPNQGPVRLRYRNSRFSPQRDAGKTRPLDLLRPHF